MEPTPDAEPDAQAPGSVPADPEPAVDGPAVDGPAAPSVADASDGEVASRGSTRYEIVFDCRDRMLGARLLSRIEDVIGPTFPVQRGEEGATWSATIEFPDPQAADRFFDSDFYRQFCTEVRRTARSSVLVVPHGSPDD